MALFRYYKKHQDRQTWEVIESFPLFTSIAEAQKFIRPEIVQHFRNISFELCIQEVNLETEVLRQHDKLLRYEMNLFICECGYKILSEEFLLGGPHADCED